MNGAAAACVLVCFLSELLSAWRSMRATRSVDLLGLLTFLWTLSRADAINKPNATTDSPFALPNATIPSDEGSSGVGAIIGRVGVALCVAGAVGVILYCLRKQCPRKFAYGENQPVLDRRRMNRESRRLNGDVVSNTSRSAPSRPLPQQLHKDPGSDSDHTEQS